MPATAATSVSETATVTLPAASVAADVAEDAQDTAFWQLPENATARVVDNAADLASAHSDIFGGGSSAVDAVGIDAEWAPGAATPSAALLQLALRSRATGDCTALVLDLLALPREQTAAFVQRLLADATVLKLGFGLAGDLWAVAERLGLAAVRSIQPAVDVRPLQQVLARRGALPQAPLPGLSGMASLHLGSPLDKALQCCEWEGRPLSRGQLDYAAADAVCLLHIMDAMAAAAPPQHNALTDSQARSAAERTGSAAAADKDKLPAHRSMHSSLCFDADVVTQHWGETWTLSLSKGRKRVEGQVASRLMASMASPLRKSAVDDLTGRPMRLPWSQPEDARFVCDVMAEGLARQLRLCGLDAASAPVDPHTEPRHRIYRALVECAEAEGRVVLTADRTFIAGRYCEASYFIRGADKKAQLQEVLMAFSIDTDTLGLLSRCAKCNGEFEPRPLSAEELPDGSPIPAGVRSAHQQFWRCGRCGHIYWHGAQYSNAVGRLTRELQRFAVR